MEHYQNKLITCPYDEAHKMKESRLQMHIAKCKKNHLDKEMVACPFNATHVHPPSEHNYHLMNCTDRASLDRHMAQQSLDKNNPFKGRTAVPSYTQSPPILTNESWDDQISGPAPGYVPRAPPVDAVLEPPPMSKPAEKRQFYKELWQRDDNKDDDSTLTPTRPSVPRQPKTPSEAQKLQSLKQMEIASMVSPNLGLGRGKPVLSNRIAASIFPKPNESEESSEDQYNNIVNSMNQLGIGRGQSANGPYFLDNEDFPVLGRGMIHSSKQVPRTPGQRPNN